MPTLRPKPVYDTEFVTVRVFIACDPMQGPVDDDNELLGLFATAAIGHMSFDLLHQVVELSSHCAEIADALRPQVQPQQIRDAVMAYRSNPQPFALGETQGIWITMQVPKKVLRGVVMQPRLVPVPVRTAPRRPSLFQTMFNTRPRLTPPRPKWA
jgi:hypothetical protein